MTQHFLKRAACRDFTVKHVALMSEEEAHEMFIELRWGGWDQVVCPHCGVIGKHYYRQTRRQWRCKDCNGYFSATTQTPFQDHKLSFKHLLLGMKLYLSSSNGISLHRLARDMGVQIKTAQVFVGKLREVMCGMPKEKLSGIVQMDGGYFGGCRRHGRIRKRSEAEITSHVEAQLQKKKRPFRSAANWKRLKKRRVIMVLRELHPEPKYGAVKTITAVCMAEDAASAISLAKAYVEPGSLIMTDDCDAYSQLSQLPEGERYRHESVVHSLEFSTIDGINDNQAESYFSRVRRHVKGVSHRIEPKYMADIATEMAWREDTRHHTEKQKLDGLLKATLNYGLSKWWRGYWQGHHRKGEILWGTKN